MTEELYKMTINKFISIIYCLIIGITCAVISMSCLFGYYIYKSYGDNYVEITQTQEGANNFQEIDNETNSDC